MLRGSASLHTMTSHLYSGTGRSDLQVASALKYPASESSWETTTGRILYLKYFTACCWFCTAEDPCASHGRCTSAPAHSHYTAQINRAGVSASSQCKAAERISRSPGLHARWAPTGHVLKGAHARRGRVTLHIYSMPKNNISTGAFKKLLIHMYSYRLDTQCDTTWHWYNSTSQLGAKMTTDHMTSKQRIPLVLKVNMHDQMYKLMEFHKQYVIPSWELYNQTNVFSVYSEQSSIIKWLHLLPKYIKEPDLRFSTADPLDKV